MTGVRAYERRDDLRANNSRLLEYVFNGGTVIVQYNKFEFNDAQYGPYPAKVSSNRITNENARGAGDNAEHPLLTQPNEINETTWQNWVQERGLYFLAEDKDSRYQDVARVRRRLHLQQRREDRRAGRGDITARAAGCMSGSACGGSCRSGTDGAYQLLANLLSLGKRSQIADGRFRVRIETESRSAICNHNLQWKSLSRHSNSRAGAARFAPRAGACPGSRGAWSTASCA